MNVTAQTRGVLIRGLTNLDEGGQVQVFLAQGSKQAERMCSYKESEEDLLSSGMGRSPWCPSFHVPELPSIDLWGCSATYVAMLCFNHSHRK